MHLEYIRKYKLVLDIIRNIVLSKLKEIKNKIYCNFNLAFCYSIILYCLNEKKILFGILHRLSYIKYSQITPDSVNTSVVRCSRMSICIQEKNKVLNPTVVIINLFSNAAKILPTRMFDCLLSRYFLQKLWERDFYLISPVTLLIEILLTKQGQIIDASRILKNKMLLQDIKKCNGESDREQFREGAKERPSHF